MLVSPKWQTMWVESQHRSKNGVSLTLPCQTKKILEDLRMSCNSPNKAVQLQALKCWGIWISSQNPDDWKLNTVCYTAIRPLIAKKLQPLHRDVDICKLKLSLMWSLLVKVQDIMQLEGPQYILEGFLQSCLTWLSSGDGVDNEICSLIFQLLLALFKNNSNLISCNLEMFPPLSADVLGSKKVFQHLADKFLNVFFNWSKVKDKSVIVKIWKCFLEHCEHSCENLPIHIWHKVFKIAAQICSEANEPVKERLRFLHGCATTSKSVLSSSKFIDFGNLLTTPCEALLKKLIDLCTVDCEEFCDVEMFQMSREISEVLLNESVGIGGFDLCIFVVDVLEEFFLKCLFWGVWCGLVHCYKTRLMNLDKNQFTKNEMKFFRKLRGVAVNFNLDRSYLHEDCIVEVEKHIEILEIRCFCRDVQFLHQKQPPSLVGENPRVDCSDLMEVDVENEEKVDSFPDHHNDVSNKFSGQMMTLARRNSFKEFSKFDIIGRRKPLKTVNLKFDLIKDIIQKVDLHAAKSLLEGLFFVRFIGPKNFEKNNLEFKFSLQTELSFTNKNEIKLTCKIDNRLPITGEVPAAAQNAVVPYSPKKKNSKVSSQEVVEEETISTPLTRSKKRAEELSRRETTGYQTRKKRKSFEVLVQEIVNKNKLRKTEKNSVKRKSPVSVNKKEKLKTAVSKEKCKKNEEKEEQLEEKSKKVEPLKKDKKGKEGEKSIKVDGKLENYFKIISRSKGEVEKREEEDCKCSKKKKKSLNTKCCDSKKEENISWKQTSLKSMMDRKMKIKEVKAKHGMLTRNQKSDGGEKEKKKEKAKSEKKAVKEKPPMNSSPFKEILHDHEYTKVVEPSNLGAPECFGKAHVKENDVRKENPSFEDGEGKSTNNEVIEEGEVKDVCTKKLKEDEALVDEIISDVEEDRFETIESVEDKSVSGEEEIENIPTEKKTAEEESHSIADTTQTLKNESHNYEEENENCGNLQPEVVEEMNSEKSEDDVIILDDFEEKISESDETFVKRGKKRIRMLDSLKPSKKIKLDACEDAKEEDLTCLESIEKENLEIVGSNEEVVLVTPTKEVAGDKSPTSKVKDDVSPNGNCKSRNTGQGCISSRALRMIALVPESTKPGQVHRGSPTAKTETKAQAKKAPNVDKNSRASKMLALLHDSLSKENDFPMKEEDMKSEEIVSYGSWQQVTEKPLTPTLKSPKSTKKRKSIRFDDAKNETVLYDIDTPPSKILESRRSKELIPGPCLN